MDIAPISSALRTAPSFYTIDWCIRYDIHGLHSLHRHAVLLHNIASSLPASIPASSVTAWPTIAGLFALILPHDQLIPEQLSCSLSGLVPAAVPPVVL